ncbi:hypothetical protein ABFS83_08G033200 [Erythranthe nasuta]
MEAKTLFMFVFFLISIFAAQESMGNQCFDPQKKHCRVGGDDCLKRCSALGYRRGLCFRTSSTSTLCMCECD